ncbi:MAG TPA: hypothetical protein VFC10_18475 [Terriglobia bacterium]|nr:hypothetical protein [Terriglobia bacterium]
MLLQRYRSRHGHPPSQPIVNLFLGIARRLTQLDHAGFDWRHWGRSLRAKKGGYAVQRKYRLEGRNAGAIASVRNRAIRKRALLPFERHGMANLDGI